MGISVHSPSSPLRGSLSIGGSKSISNRLLILNAIGKLSLQFENLSDAEDTVLLQKALHSLKDSNTSTIDVNHAGTDFRFLTALLSVTPGQWTLTGSERMKQRPVGELVSALQQLGAHIHYSGQEGYPPLVIEGNLLQGGTASIPGNVSSQFISALLLIAPSLSQGLDLRITTKPVSWPYIQMTIDLLKDFGAAVTVHSKEHITVSPSPLYYPNASFAVESDWSSASYWYSMTALAQDAEIHLSHYHVASSQADAVLPAVYASLGVYTQHTNSGIQLRKQPIRISEFAYDFTECPDIAQTVAVTCAGLGIPAQLNGLSTLTIKETDRISALKQELEACGVRVDATSHSLTITPPQGGIHAVPSQFRTYHDHRMAMSFVPLCLKTGSISLDDRSVTDKSYPRFWDDLKAMGFYLD